MGHILSLHNLLSPISLTSTPRCLFSLYHSHIHSSEGGSIFPCAYTLGAPHLLYPLLLQHPFTYCTFDIEYTPAWNLISGGTAKPPQPYLLSPICPWFKLFWEISGRACGRGKRPLVHKATRKCPYCINILWEINELRNPLIAAGPNSMQSVFITVCPLMIESQLSKGS